MWILEIIGCGPHPVRYHLVGGTSYTLGRRDCTILLPPNDPSISRHQCTLIVQPTDIRHITTRQQLSTTSLESIQRRRREGVSRFAGGKHNQTPSNDGCGFEEESGGDGGGGAAGLRGQSTKHYALTPDVILIDNSKHGCYVNDVKVDSISKKAMLGEHDVIRLGAHVEIALYYRPIVATLSPTLSGLQCNNVTRVLSKLGCAINNPRKPVVSADAAITSSPRHNQSLHSSSVIVGGAGRDTTARARTNYSGIDTTTTTPTKLNQYGGLNESGSMMLNSSPNRNQMLIQSSMNSSGRRRSSASPPRGGAGIATMKKPQYNIRYVPSGKNAYERGTITAFGGSSSGYNNTSLVAASSPSRSNFNSRANFDDDDDEDDNDIEGRSFFNYNATDDIKLYLDPQNAREKHFSPISFVYVTERLQLNEPTCMMAMLLGYRPVDIGYLFTLYEVLLQSPATPMTRWPEPRILEEMMLVDRPYFKTPVFLQDFRHTIPKTFTSMFRLLNFGTLEKRLHDQYSDVIVKGGGRCFLMDPERVNGHFGDTGKFQRELPSHDISLTASMNGSIGGASSVGGLSRAPSMAFSTFSGGSALTRGTSGYRRARRMRAKKIPTCLKLLGIVDSPLDAHGVNLRVLISEDMFLYLTHAFKKATERRKKELESRVRRQLHNESNPALGISTNTLQSEEDDELPPEAFGVDPTVADAAINLFDNGYLLVHEDNVHSAIYTNDPAGQFRDTSPGVLAKSVMVDKADQTDSDDTVDEDEERLQDYHRHNYSVLEGVDISGGGGGGAADHSGMDFGNHNVSGSYNNTNPTINDVSSHSHFQHHFSSAAIPDDDPVSLLMMARRRGGGNGIMSPNVKVCSAQQVNTVTSTGDQSGASPSTSAKKTPIRMASTTPPRQFRR